MANDQQTFRRAEGAALAGLLTQLALGIGMALVGLYAQAPAIHAAGWHFFGGLPIWIILWILFHQHRLERIEALEAEELARADARTAAIFDEAGMGLQIARKRLDQIHKWWLPIVSGLVALYLAGFGGSLLYLNARAYNAGQLRDHAIAARALENLGVLGAVLIAIAFIGFLVARYVAGMTQVREWQPLRGGASYLIGCVVVAITLVVAAIAAWFGNTSVFAVLALVIPGIMLLLATEMVLSLVFGLYRPRRPGQYARPAFDSGLLGWLTRPESLGKIINEAINYQFGFEISRSWFYRLLGKAITPLVIVGALVLVGLSSLVIVAPQQQGVVTRFGQFVRIAEPGLSFKLPWPIERVELAPVYEVQQVTIGSEEQPLSPGVPILWTNQHAESKEQYVVTAPVSYAENGEGSRVVAGELAGVRVAVQFLIKDLEQYRRAAADPREVVRSLAARRVNRYLVSHTLDALLTTQREKAGEELRQAIQEDIDTFSKPLGVDIVFVGFESIHPPQEGDVAKAYQAQIDARQEKASAILDAEREEIRILAEVAGSREMAMRIDQAIAKAESLRAQVRAARATADGAARAAELQQLADEQEVEVERLLDEAGGDAAQVIYAARAYRWQQALGERARAMRMQSLYQSYRAAPEYFKRRLFLDAVADGLKTARKTVIVPKEGATIDLRANLESEGADMGVFSLPASQ